MGKSIKDRHRKVKACAQKTAKIALALRRPSPYIFRSF
jgi:hypothetical protein